MRTVLAVCLRWFAYIWIGLLALSVPLSWVGTYLKTRSLWQTWAWIQEVWNPFNLWQYLLMAILASPALGAYWLSDRIARVSQTGKQ